MYRCKVPKSMTRQTFKKRVALVLQQNMPVSNSINSTSQSPEDTNSHNFLNDTDWPWSDSDSDCDSEIEVEPVRTWYGELRAWALRNNVNHTTINDLLRVLLSFNIKGIPKDARTIMKTPTKTIVSEISGGSYWHNGITKNLLIIYSGDKHRPKEIEMMVNVDGVPISRSSHSQFWPIIGQIHKAEVDPFFIGIFHGHSKPKDMNEFLLPFVNELKDVMENGVIIDGIQMIVKFRCFLCDAPAKCSVKCIAYHVGYFACNFCCVEGQYDDYRMSYPDFECQLRTDESFRNKNQIEHHNSTSIVEELPIDMVKCFPNDYLHLILLGITKTLGKTWTLGNNYETKLSAHQITLINNMLTQIAKFQPDIWARKIRTLTYLKKWKGTELRTWLLYVGPVVLKGILSARAYTHFLALHCAVRICTCSLVDTHLLVAEQLFKFFAEEYIEIYGEQTISYNIHNVVHVAEDVRNFGRLDSFSCFPAENQLGVLKNLLRKGDKPLAQAINRLTERELLDPKRKQLQKTKLKEERIEEKGVFEKLIYKGMCFDTSHQNKWFLTYNKDVVEFEKAFYLEGNIVVSGCKIKRKYDFFEKPLRSSFLDIYTSNGLKDSSQIFQITAIKTKMFGMSTNDWGIMYNVIESVDDKGRRNVFCAPENWIIDDILYWPNNAKKVNQYRRTQKIPEIGWKTIASYKVLKKNLLTYKDALEKEKMLELHSDTESVQEAERRKAQKRRHPANSISDSFELNSLFQNISDKKNITETRHELQSVKQLKQSTGLNALNLLGQPTGNVTKEPIGFSVEIIKEAQSLEYNYKLPSLGGEDLGEYAIGDMVQMNYPLDNQDLANETNESNGVTNEISSLNYRALRNYEETNSSVGLLSYESKLDALLKKLDSIEAKQDKFQKDVETRQIGIVEKLKNIEAKQDAMLKIQAGSHVKLDLLGNQSNASKNDIEIQNDVEIPILSQQALEDIDSLMNFEMTLKKSTDLANAMFNELKFIGGANSSKKKSKEKNDPSKCTKNILVRLFTDDLLVKYTWNGTADKFTFSSFTAVHTLIKKCVRLHCEDFTDDDYKMEVQEHLKHAGTRIMRRYEGH